VAQNAGGRKLRIFAGEAGKKGRSRMGNDIRIVDGVVVEMMAVYGGGKWLRMAFWRNLAGILAQFGGIFGILAVILAGYLAGIGRVLGRVFGKLWQTLANNDGT
jgi:hypothetical protein